MTGGARGMADVGRLRREYFWSKEAIALAVAEAGRRG